MQGRPEYYSSAQVGSTVENQNHSIDEDGSGVGVAILRRRQGHPEVALASDLHDQHFMARGYSYRLHKIPGEGRTNCSYSMMHVDASAVEV